MRSRKLAAGVAWSAAWWFGAGCAGAPVDEPAAPPTEPRAVPEPASDTAGPRPLPRRADLNSTLLEVAMLEDQKERANGRLAALLAGDPDPAVRRAAAMALGHIHDPEDAAALLAAYGDRDLAVAEAALFATGLLADGDRRAPAAPLVPLCSHESPRIRAAAVEALGRIGDASTAEVVADLIQDPDATVRGEAALAAWRLVGGAPALPKLAEGATDEDRARHAAAEAVRDRVYAVTLPLARAADRERDPEARWRMIYAVAALRRPTQRKGPPPPSLADDATAELARLASGWLAAPDALTRGYAALAAGRALTGAAAGTVLAPLLADPDWNVRVWAVGAVQASKAEGVLEGLRTLAARDPHPLVRETAFGALAALKDAEAVPIAEAALRGDDPTARRAACAVLAALQGAGALAVLREGLGSFDPRTRAAAIAAMGEALGDDPAAPHVAETVAVLDEAFGTGGLQVRVAVLEAAAKLPAATAAALAARGLASDDLEVRGTACDLIKTRADAFKGGEPDLTAALLAAWARWQAPADWELRQLALDALTALGDDRALPALRAGLADPFRHVREAARAGIEKRTGEKPDIATGPDPVLGARPDAVEARALDLPRRLRIVTTKGAMLLELYPEDAPLHVLNVVQLARKGFYDGLAWHRVVPSFVIQGGCPRGTGWGDAGYLLANEFNPRRFVRGALGMPRSNDPDSGGCQLFINHLPTPHLDGLYTVFGRVIEGLDVIDRIEVGDRIVTVRDE